MSPDLDRERRLGRFAGAAALGGVACWLGALLLANAGVGDPGSAGGLGGSVAINRAAELSAFSADVGDQRLATMLRCLGLLLSGAMAAYLYLLVRARYPRASRQWLLWSAFAGVALLCAASIEGDLALSHVARIFAASGTHTQHRAQRLMDASTPLEVAAILDVISRVAFAFWIAAISLQMLRVQLLDSFLAYWGFGAAGSLVLLSIGDAMFIGWLASLGFLALGYWPGGRPEAWSRPIQAGA